MVLRVMLPELGRDTGPELLVRAKIVKHLGLVTGRGLSWALEPSIELPGEA